MNLVKGEFYKFVHTDLYSAYRQYVGVWDGMIVFVAIGPNEMFNIATNNQNKCEDYVKVDKNEIIINKEIL